MNYLSLYLGIPVLIMIGLCFASYLLGKYVRSGPKSDEETKRLQQAIEEKNKRLEENAGAIESAKKDRKELQELLAKVQGLEEENKRLQQVVEDRNKELGERIMAAAESAESAREDIKSNEELPAKIDNPEPEEEKEVLKQAFIGNKDAEPQVSVETVEPAQKPPEESTELPAKSRRVKESANAKKTKNNKSAVSKKNAPSIGEAKSKNIRTIKTMARRTQNVLGAFRKLGKCADRTVYKYGDEEITKIFHVIENDIKRTRTLFNSKTGKTAAKFSL